MKTIFINQKRTSDSLDEKEAIPFFNLDAVKLSESSFNIRTMCQTFAESDQYDVRSIAETYDYFLNNKHIEVDGYYRVPDFMVQKNDKKYCVEVSFMPRHLIGIWIFIIFMRVLKNVITYFGFAKMKIF